MEPTKRRLFWDDTLLILTMAVLAGCGLIYEYLLSHYAGRVLGIMESTIYAMIGLMIVAMGFGAFAARKINCAFNGFVWLELIIAFLGASAIIIIGGLIAFTQTLPYVIAETFSFQSRPLIQSHVCLHFSRFLQDLFHSFMVNLYKGRRLWILYCKPSLVMSSAPFSCPNSSESIVPSGIAPQFTAMYLLCFLALN